MKNGQSEGCNEKDALRLAVQRPAERPRVQVPLPRVDDDNDEKSSATELAPSAGRPRSGRNGRKRAGRRGERINHRGQHGLVVLIRSDRRHQGSSILQTLRE